MEKKYELTDITINWHGRVLHRIKALRDIECGWIFRDVSVGELGGFIEKEENLSHEGDCWIFQDAKVYDNAIVTGDAQVFQDAQVYDNAKIGGTSIISDNAQIHGNATIDFDIPKNIWCDGKSEIDGYAEIYGNASIIGCNLGTYLKISGSIRVYNIFIDNHIKTLSYDHTDKSIQKMIEEGKKYRLINICEKVGKRKLYRIQALRDINNPHFNVKAGDVGGFIEKEENLSHEGNCWVSNYAQVYGNAKVYGNAFISSGAEVYGNAQVYGNAEINYGDPEVYGNAQVYGNACISEFVKVYDNAQVYEYADLEGKAEICGNAKVHGQIQLYYFDIIDGDIDLIDEDQLYDNDNDDKEGE